MHKYKATVEFEMDSLNNYTQDWTISWDINNHQKILNIQLICYIIYRAMLAANRRIF